MDYPSKSSPTATNYSCHPETDGSSEQSNKTVIQAIRFHVERNQQGWVRALPFQLRFGRRPRLIPPIMANTNQAEPADRHAKAIIERINHDMWEAQDNLLKAKISQAQQANKSRLNKFPFEVGQRVRLSTLHRRRDYKSKDQKRVVKFMPRYDGPYIITKIDPGHSTVTLDIPHDRRIFPVFHISEVLPFIENNEELFPSLALHTPEPVVVNNNLEYL